MRVAGTDSPNGIFPYLVDNAAIVDTCRISVWGEQLSPDQGGLVDVRNTASLSKNSRFARCLTAKSRDTGNDLQVAYGKVGSLPAIPAAMIVFRSEVVPISGSQIMRETEGLFPTANRVELSLVELRFDISTPEVTAIRKQAIHRARQTCSLIDDGGHRTFYAGSRGSQSELRAYDKADGIIRIEFVFRRPFLVKNGLLRPVAVLQLRGFDLERLVSFRRVSRERLEEAAPDRSAKWREAVIQWAERWPISKLPSYLRERGIPPGKVLRRSRLQLKVERMQKNLIW